MSQQFDRGAEYNSAAQRNGTLQQCAGGRCSHDPILFLGDWLSHPNAAEDHQAMSNVFQQINSYLQRKSGHRKPMCCGKSRRLGFQSLESRNLLTSFGELIDPNPSPGNRFGDSVVALETGNIVVSAPFDDAGGVDAGAVYLFNGSTGDLVSTLIGGSPNDRIGLGGFWHEGVVALGNGNFVVNSPFWDRGAISDAGAVTFGDGKTGVSGVVDASNSLIGGVAGDQVGRNGVIVLDGGSFVVSSQIWDNGAAINAGAVTFGDGESGVTGMVDENNSLVGSTSNDFLGSGFVLPLEGGGYVVGSPFLDFGGSAEVGAVTFGEGEAGVSGVIDAGNSLLGANPNDQVGGFGDVEVFQDGSYAVVSDRWDNGMAADAGAVTFASSANGVSGVISASNSLVGTHANDRVGSLGVVELSNSNRVVISPNWDNGGMSDVGAVTFVEAGSELAGPVSATNSLVGDGNGDRVGSNGVVPLGNGNYIVLSSRWSYPGAVEAGAVTFGNGSTGVSGVVSVANSLIGASSLDRIGNRSGVTELGNGNYVVVSVEWDNGSAVNAGAVTFGDGINGVSGVVDASNSLVGTQSGDAVGGDSIGGVLPLANGNYVVRSPRWDNVTEADVGAVTFGNGTTGVFGEISTSNSLVGSSESDQFGAAEVIGLTNGNYVVSSPFWDNGDIEDVGAVTLGDGTKGIVGFAHAGNSLIGSTASDFVGGRGVRALPNGNYVVLSGDWNNGAVFGAGAVTFGDGLVGVVGVVGPGNSLVGASPFDQVGTRGVTLLTNGHFVFTSPEWDNTSGSTAVVNAGAVTFVDGEFGGVGVVDASNSLVGTASFDRVGSGGVLAFGNGNYLVDSPDWDNGESMDAGAVTFGNAHRGGASGPVSFLNSLFGQASETGLQRSVSGEANGSFYSAFVDEGGGRVRVGSQNFGSAVVNDTGDIDDGDIGNGVTTLREAINLANLTPGPDTITFDAGVFSGGTASLIRLGGTELEITDTLTIDGSTAVDVTISGDTDGDDVTDTTNMTDVAASFGGVAGAADDLLDDNTRVLNFSASTGDLTLERLRITGGRTTGAFDAGGGVRFLSDGQLTVTRSTLSGNSTAGESAAGGAVHLLSGSVQVVESTLHGNRTFGNQAHGGGLHAFSGAIDLGNSTITGNSVAGSSGLGGGVATFSGNVSLRSSTVSGNVAAAEGGGVYAGNLGNNSPTFVVQNSIVATNIGNSVPSDISLEDSRVLVVEHSLLGDTGVGLAASHLQSIADGNGNLQNVDPMLDALSDNGGPTMTLALLPGSPAIDSGDAAELSIDQRGVSRPQGATADMGAFESSVPLQLLSFTRQSPTQVVTSEDTLGFRAEFSETVQRVTADDFVVSGGASASVTEVLPIAGTGEIMFMLVVSGGDLEDFNGAVGVDLNPGQDIVGVGGDALPTLEPLIDEVFTLDNVSPRVSAVQIDDGGDQRSRVRSIAVDFDSPIVFEPGAFQVETKEGVPVLVAANVVPGVTANQIELSFPNAANGSLDDGNYRLTVLDSRLRDIAGNALDGDQDGTPGGIAIDQFFRLYGDSDGDRDVDGQDYGRFGLTFLRASSDAGFDARLDFDDDGDVDGQDYGQFGLRFLTSLGA